MAGKSTRPITLIVADDEQFSRSVAERILRGIGFVRGPEPDTITVLPEAKKGQEPHIVTARDGREVIEILSGTPAVDGLITDIEMPRMTGIELLRAIRTGRTRARHSLPVGMLTGHTQAHLVSEAMALDVNAFIAKPVSKDLLQKRIGRLFLRPQLKSIEIYDEIRLTSTTVAQPTHAEIFNESVQAALAEAAAASDVAEAAANDTAAAAEAVLPIGWPQPLNRVRSGAILARDVLATGGTVLINAGEELTDHQLDRLRELRDMGVPVEPIWVAA